jgi:hypothetical protein
LLAPVRLVSLIARYNPVLWDSDPLLGEARGRTRELESRDVSKLAWGELLAMVDAAKEIPQLAAGKVRYRYFPRAAFSIALLRLMLALLGRADQMGTLLSGTENMTLEANRAIGGLAERVRSDPDLTQVFSTNGTKALWSALEEQPSGRAFLIELRAFLHRYGHRESSIGTALEPTWKDAPEVVLGIIKSLAAQHSKWVDASSVRVYSICRRTFFISRSPNLSGWMARRHRTWQ